MEVFYAMILRHIIVTPMQPAGRSYYVVYAGVFARAFSCVDLESMSNGEFIQFAALCTSTEHV